MRRLIILFLLISICCFATAQTQQGYVKTRGRMNAAGSVTAGSRLPGATLNIKNASSIVSGNGGTFSFAVPSKSFRVTGVQKQGYVLCDYDLLNRNHQYSANPFIVVMETPENNAADRLAAEQKIRRTLRRQLQEKEDELEALKAQQKITEAEFNRQLQEFYAKQGENEKLIAEMADRYSTIDFDQLDEFQRQVAFFIQNGELTRADSLLNTKGSMDDRSEELDRMDAAIKADKEEIAERQKAHDKSVAMKAKLLEDFAADFYNYYEICRLQHKNDSAAYYLELRASKDTLNIDWLLEAGVMYDVYCAQPDKAQQIFLLAYNNSVQVYGEASWQAALCIRNLAASCSLANKYAEALAYYERERQILQDTYGDDWPLEALVWYNNVAAVVTELGDFEKAIEYYQHYIDVLSNFEGENPTAYMRSYNNLASVYDRAGDYKKALELYQKALAIEENRESPNAEHLATIHNNLGITYTHLEQRDLSIAETELAYEYYVEAFGESHPNVSLALNALGTGYYRKGDLNEAYKCFGKALEIMLDTYGEYHITTAIVYNNIAIIFSNAGMHEDALEMLNKEMEIKRLVLGEDNIGLADVYELIGMEYAYLGKNEEAKRYLMTALDRQRAAWGDDNINLVTAYTNIATVLSGEGDYNEAEEYFHKAIDIMTKEYGENSGFLADAYGNWGVMLFKQEKHEKAYPLFVKALNISCEVKGKEHPETIVAYNNLANCCRMMKRYREAIDYRYKSLASSIKTYGYDHQNTINSYMNLEGYFLEALNTGNPEVSKDEYTEFFSDLMYIADFVEGDTPARQQGLGGEFYLFRFEDWTPESLMSLESINEAFRGKPKTLVVMDKEGNVSTHHFENTIGASFSIKYVGKEEKQRLVNLLKF